MQIGEAEELLRASALVLGCAIPLDEERAEVIADLIDCTDVLAATTMRLAPCAAGSR